MLAASPSALLFVTTIAVFELDVTVAPSTNVPLTVIDFVVSEVISTFCTVAVLDTFNEASFNVTFPYTPLLRVTDGISPSVGAVTVKLVDSVPVLLIVTSFAEVNVNVDSVPNSVVTVVACVVSGTVILFTTPSEKVTLFDSANF